MSCRECERYFFSETEWELLLAGLGIQTWYGLGGGESSKRMDRRAYHAILAGLYQKNVIEWDKDGVRLRQPFSRIFETLNDSPKCVTIDRKSREFPVQCCYAGTRGVVLTEKSQREQNTLCVFYLSKEEFISLIAEYLSEYSEGIFLLPETEARANGQEKLMLELRDCRSGERMEKLTLHESGLQTYLTVETKKNAIRIPYGRNRFKEYVKGWLY